MNNPQEPPAENNLRSPRRPGLVTVMAVLVALSSITEGLTCVGLFLHTKSGNPVVTFLLFLLCPLVMGLFLFVAWGLWKLKNWARYALIALIVITFISDLSGVSDVYRQNPVVTVLVILLSLAFRVAIIYWFVGNGKYFDGSAFAGMPQAVVENEEKQKSTRNNGFIRMIVVSSVVGSCLIAMILVYLGYLIINRKPTGSSPTRAFVTAPAQAAAPTLAVKQYASAPLMTIDVKKQYFADFKMARGGEFMVQLYPDKAPITVNSFVFLARAGFFNGLTFHRVLEGFMAQGGDPTGTGMGGPGYQFVNEDNDLKFDKAGVLAMANAGRDTNGSQFFITFGPATRLNGDYTIFGQVISGMEVVNGITQRDPQQNPTFPGDVIQTITITEK